MYDVTLGRLMGAINKSVEAQFKNRLSDFDFNFSYLQYLLVISAYEGINQNELAKKMNVGKGSVSKAVKYLLKNGLVSRRQDTTDTRIKNVYITGNGKQIADGFKVVFIELNSKIAEGFSKSELITLRKMLGRIYNNVAIGGKHFILEDLNFLDE